MASNNTTSNLFQQAVSLSFQNWTAFQLAVAHSFGGKETREKAEWFPSATYDWILENDSKLDEYDLQEFFEETMDNEFNTKLEDNSAIILSRLILGYYKVYKNGQHNELAADLAQRFPAKSANSNVNSSVRHRDANRMDGDDDDTSSGSDYSEDENNNEEMCEDMNCDGEEKQRKSKLEEIKESEDFQMVDDGWTFVAKSGKKLTK